MKITVSSLKFILLCMLVIECAAGVCCAQVLTDVPEKARDIGVDEHLGDTIPLNLVFEDDRGRRRELSQIVNGSQPILLTLNYSNCPGLCVAQLDGLAEAVNDLYEVQLGKDFQLVSISIDPTETRQRAESTKLKYTTGLLKPHDNDAWHFLTGSPENIQAIAKAVGFRYKYDRASDQYSHVAAAIAISPQGKITRYIYDVSFDPNTLRLALMEASEGKIGTTVDAFMLWCMTYDGKENRYSADARKLLAIVAGIFTVVLVGASIPFWMKKTPPLGANQLVSKNDLNGGVSPKMVSVEDKDVSVDARVAPVNDLALDEVNEKLCSTSDK